MTDEVDKFTKKYDARFIALKSDASVIAVGTQGVVLRFD